MVVAENDMAVLIDEIWLTMLGMAVHRATPGEPHLRADEPQLDGIINITGDWQATVALQVPRLLATRIATVMFHLTEKPPTLEDMQDAVGELTNMLGGNIKALYSGESHLSLPMVIEGSGYSVRVPSTHVLSRVEFMCEGYPAAVNLLARAAQK